MLQHNNLIETFPLAPAIVLGNEASSSTSSSSPIHLDMSLILPTAISLVIVFLVILLGSVWHLRRRQSNTSFYGSPGVYDSAKSDGNETIRLAELDQNHSKKLNCDASSALDSGYYPSPYAMTQFNSNGGDVQCGVHLMDTLPMHTSPLKAMASEGREGRDNEPLYATVKRTPRASRSDVHIYQFPSKSTTF